jgi:site-specific recombinase XerD
MELKHHTLVSIPGRGTITGHDRWILIDSLGNSVLGFDMFCDALIRAKNAKNTIDAYCNHLAKFIDYLTEVSLVAPSFGIHHVSGIFLSDIISSYPEFLTGGINNNSEMISKVAENLGRQPLTSSSLTPHLAAVNRYLELSENFYSRLIELQNNGEDLGLISEQALFPSLLQKAELHQREKIAINQKSVLAGVICGGAKLKRIVTLKAPRKNQTNGKNIKAFPDEHFLHFIENGFTNYRDKAFYCLTGAAGIRISEAKNIIFADLNTETSEVYIVDPKDRSVSEYNNYLTVQEKDALSFKCRDTVRTLFIEPWGTMFWHYLSLYLKHEYVPTDKHPFVFQKIHASYLTEPLIEADDKSLRDTFKAALKRCNLSTQYSVHSLRHMYGVYLRNYYPNETGGYGLSDTTIKSLMGHRDLSSTQQYAIPNIDLMKARQKLSLLMMTSPSQVKLQVTADSLRTQLKLVESRIKQDVEESQLKLLK